MLRAVAEETRKWEEREARWVQRLRVLESKEASPTATASASDSRTTGMLPVLVILCLGLDVSSKRELVLKTLMRVLGLPPLM